MTGDYRDVNRANWDERAAAHASSPDYRLDSFRTDPTYVSDVVRFDLPRLGPVAGLRGAHLQCHIGTDTVSLARLGATMTGLDFSGEALTVARDFSRELGLTIDFVEAELYAAPEVLPAAAFDFVFTGIGALGWLPNVHKWAQVVAGLLVPGGRLFLREGHPVLFSLADPRPDGLLAIEHPYFEHNEPTVWDEPGTYVATDTEFTQTVTHEWNHGMAEIITALLIAGLTITAFEEHDSVPWNALDGYMHLGDDGEYRLNDRPGRVPLSYTLQAAKPA